MDARSYTVRYDYAVEGYDRLYHARLTTYVPLHYMLNDVFKSSKKQVGKHLMDVYGDRSCRFCIKSISGVTMEPEWEKLGRSSDK